jgi:hypothetical protein
MLLYVGVHSASNHIHPSFSYIMSLRDVVIYARYMLSLTTLLVRNGYLAENRVLPTKKGRTVQIRCVQVLCTSTKFYTCTMMSSSSHVQNYWWWNTRDNGYAVMLRRQYKIIRCNISHKDFKTLPHDLQCNVAPLPPHTSVTTRTGWPQQGISLLSQWFLSSFAPIHFLHGCRGISSSRGVFIGRKVTNKLKLAKYASQFIVGSAKNARRFTNSKSVNP